MSVTVMARPLAFQTFLMAAPMSSSESRRAAARGDHLREQRLQDLHVLVDVLDQGERIERHRGVLGELDHAAAEVAACLLVAAAEVDDPDAAPMAR